jgi:flavin reductase (DIM6/NTAB) family NADH-FMN oxidoreductase RutF
MSKMRHIDPKSTPIPEVHRALLGGVAPRPIALVSTLSKEGIRNLAPFSFFNAFGANPPTIAFSPARRGRDATLKDTYQNLVDTKECVVQAVTYDIVHQVNLASAEFETGVDEFVRSGLTPVASDLIKPFRVKESPFQMECAVKQIINLGETNASGNLIVCEVLRFHVEEALFRDGQIQPDLIDLVGRNSGEFYTRARGDAIFRMARPDTANPIGYDKLPDFIKHSSVLTGNDLGNLATAESIPTREEVLQFVEGFKIADASEHLFEEYAESGDYNRMLMVAISFARAESPETVNHLELTAKTALTQRDRDIAWKALVYAGIVAGHP